MIFCFPYNWKCDKELRELTNCGRLFAYPNIPTPSKCERIILDSGAFALSRRKGYMTRAYMEDLSKHYQLHADDKTICAAPDVVRDPFKTMRNFKDWIASGKYADITPVIQSSLKGRFDVSEYTYQIDFYTSEYHVKSMMFSNRSRADEAKVSGIGKVFCYAKSRGVEYIHMLGAGWDLQDVLDWATIPCLDSIDSTSYYNLGCTDRYGSKDPIANAKIIISALSKLSER